MRVHAMALVVSTGACSPMIGQVERLESIARAHNAHARTPEEHAACSLAWEHADRVVLACDARWAAGEDARIDAAIGAVDAAERECAP